MLLCCDAHSEGILKYYTFPPGTNDEPTAGHEAHSTSSAAAAAAAEAAAVDTGKENVDVPPLLLDGDVLLEGPSQIQAFVVLLGWLRSLRDKARCGGKGEGPEDDAPPRAVTYSCLETV